MAPGVNAYSGVIAACGKQGQFDTVKGLLREMKESLGSRVRGGVGSGLPFSLTPWCSMR